MHRAIVNSVLTGIVGTALVFGAIPARAQCTSEWQAYGSPGFLGKVYTSIEYDDGTGTALFVGGTFAGVGGTNALDVAKWNGTEWLPVGTGVGTGVEANNSKGVAKFAVFDFGDGPRLVAGGVFQEVGGDPIAGLAVWDGNEWSEFPVPLEPAVFQTYSRVIVDSIATLDDGTGPALYVGGIFRFPSGSVNKTVAKWDGTQWVDLTGTTLSPDSTIRDWEVFDDGSGVKVYACGISGGGCVPSNYDCVGVMRWDGSDWEAAGQGFASMISELPDVYDLTVFDDGNGAALYACGDLRWASPSDVAKWNGSSWVPVPSTTTLSGTCYAMQVVDEGGTDVLYVGGPTPKLDGVNTRSVMKLVSGAWTSVPFGWDLGSTTFEIRSLCALGAGSSQSLAALGNFLNGDGVQVESVAVRTSGTWSTLDATSAFNAPVWDFHEVDLGSGTELFACGLFKQANGTSAHYVARWNGSSWEGFGDQITGPPWNGFASTSGHIADLETFDFGSGPELVAAGLFDHIGSSPSGIFASWNGSAWTPRGSVTGAYADGLFVYDDGSGADLYAWGLLTFPSLSLQTQLVHWDGSDWEPANLGITATFVSSLVTWNDGTTDHLFVTGSNLRRASDNAVLGAIAHFDGSTWTGVESVGDVTISGITRIRVLDLGAGPKVCIIGTFNSVAGKGGVAEWTGASWAMVGPSSDSVQRPLTARDAAVFDEGDGPALYVATTFSSDGPLGNPLPKTYFTKWDGTSWYRFPTGFDQQPQLCFTGTVPGMERVLIGSRFSPTPFSSVDGRASRFFATWGPATPQFDSRLGERFVYPTDPVEVAGELHASPSALTYQWYLGATPLVDDGRIQGVDTDTLQITSAEAGDDGMYHLVATNDCGTSSSASLRLVVYAPSCPGDITGDGVTNSADFNVLALHFGQAVPPNTLGDLTGDGFVNSADFNVLAGAFGCGS